MRIKKLVIGSKNRAKIEEWKKFLQGSFEVLTLDQVGENSDVEETGQTFSENARLKASYYAKKLNQYVFAEDGGFEIDALGGAPGVHSRRILPGRKEATDEEIVQYVLEKLEGLSIEKRKARLRVAAAISDPQGKVIFEESGQLEGYVLEKRDNSPIIEGYPYRNLLFLPELKKTYAQASDEDHEKINHKKIIAQRIKELFGSTAQSK